MCITPESCCRSRAPGSEDHRRDARTSAGDEALGWRRRMPQARARCQAPLPICQQIHRPHRHGGAHKQTQANFARDVADLPVYPQMRAPAPWYRRLAPGRSKCTYVVKPTPSEQSALRSAVVMGAHPRSPSEWLMLSFRHGLAFAPLPGCCLS